MINDVLVDAAVPCHPEHIPVEVAAEVVEITDVAAELEDVVSKDFVQIVHLIVVLQLEFGFQGELERPGDIGRFFAVQYHADDFVLFHGSLPGSAAGRIRMSESLQGKCFLPAAE
jgi:hypothetical protein